MNEPCYRGWCVGLAAGERSIPSQSGLMTVRMCAVHMREPNFTPSKNSLASAVESMQTAELSQRIADEQRSKRRRK